MKTVIIWDNTDASIEFSVQEGDLSRFNNVYINQGCGLSYELCDLVYDNEGNDLWHFVDEFPLQEVVNGAKVIVAGFIA